MNLHHLSFFSIALIAFLFLHHTLASSSHFEGFDAEDDDLSDDSTDLHHSLPPPLLTQSQSTPPPDPKPSSEPDSKSDPPKKTPSFDFWDEDEFEGLPEDEPSSSSPPVISSPVDQPTPDPDPESPDLDDTPIKKKTISSFTVEIVSVSILIAYLINYFTGKRENESLALSWATKFGLKDTIFEKNFSFLGVGEGEDSPLLLKEATNVFKFYASGRRFCHGLLATLELKSRHDLISRLFNCVVPCRDEISFEVYMNEEVMDHVVFAMARKKVAKGMFKELRDLQRFGGMVGVPGGRKWVAEELAVVSESKEVAGDMITDVVLDQVFGDKSFQKFGKYFISMHFSDQLPGKHRKMLLFKFALPDAKHMDDMVRLVALIPYYIDLIGRYKLSPQARNKTDGARQKAAQEAYKELENVRQEALQRKKAEKKEEAEAKLSAEALRKREAKERARQMKKSMPKVKMSRGH
ncbi:unnamed protein product [Eruca vesicaria subsp. sativa]|uniref:DUF1682 family protein n=1 Tax=Eruca vesicaria subsp. sativa TaxID=29727 RepID=A0ABC8LH91_ERUVS|nr:unnamed protein product [Eruca vesicaria subsp. sativa]